MTGTEIKSKPFLRWAGSKKQLVPILRKYWDDQNDTYIEPFVGSAQLFFSVQPKKAIISDINKELINTYKQIKKRPNEVFYSLSQLLPATKENYYLLRDESYTSLSIAERAARFIFLNRYCFNGLYRTNSKGKFNVPYANCKTGNIISYEGIQICSEKLAEVKIYHGDFEKIVAKYAKENDFVYLDPPYAISNKRIFQQYDPASFGINDINRLKRLLKTLNRNKTNFLLSYAYTKESKQNFNYWKQKRVITQRNISGFVDKRKRAAELLVTNISNNDK